MVTSVSSAIKKADRPPGLFPGRESVTLNSTREFLLLLFVEGIGTSGKIIVSIEIMGKHADPRESRVEMILSNSGFAHCWREKRKCAILVPLGLSDDKC